MPEEDDKRRKTSVFESADDSLGNMLGYIGNEFGGWVDKMQGKPPKKLVQPSQTPQNPGITGAKPTEDEIPEETKIKLIEMSAKTGKPIDYLIADYKRLKEVKK
jgi:hypothetical protein